MEQRDDNIVPFIGDVQIQAFISFVGNQIKWKKAWNTFEQNEKNCELWVRGELENAFFAFHRHNRFARQPDVPSTLKFIHIIVMIT